MKNESWKFDLEHPTWSTNPERLCCSQEDQRVERCVTQQVHPADELREQLTQDAERHVCRKGT